MAVQYIGVGGVARKVKAQHIGVGGVARKVKTGWTGVNGVARRCYAAAEAVKVSGSSVHPSSGYLSFGRTLSSISRVQGWLNFDNLEVTLRNADTGKLILCDAVNMDRSGDFLNSGFTVYLPSSNYTLEKYTDRDLSVNSVSVTLSFLPDRFTYAVSVDYDYHESSNLTARRQLADTDAVFYGLTITP